MIALTLDEVAVKLKKSDGRAVLRLAANDPTFPINRKVKPHLVLDEDLDAWIRAGYTDKAKRMLKGEICTDEASGESGRSASEVLDRLLEQPIKSVQKLLNTSSTPNCGTGKTG
jgi:hypothetical protein